MGPESSAADPGLVLELMFRLGQAYLACGEQTAQVELLLRRIATGYGMRRSRVVTFPTAVFITLHDGVEERVTLAEGPAQSLRLDRTPTCTRWAPRCRVAGWSRARPWSS